MYLQGFLVDKQILIRTMRLQNQMLGLVQNFDSGLCDYRLGDSSGIRDLLSYASGCANGPSAPRGGQE